MRRLLSWLSGYDIVFYALFLADLQLQVNFFDRCIYSVVTLIVLFMQKAAIKKMDMQASKEFLAELKVLTNVHHLNLVKSLSIISFIARDTNH